MGNGESTGGGYDWSNTNDNGWSSWQNTNNDGWSSWRNTNSGDDGDWSSWRNTDDNGGAFLRQLVENRDLPSSSINDLRDRYSDLLSSLQDNQLDRYRGRSPSRTPPTSPGRRSPSTPPWRTSPGRRSPSTPPWRTSPGRRSESPPPFDWHADRETPPLSRTSSIGHNESLPFSQYIDIDRSSSPVGETRSSPARNSNLIGLGINPRDWPEQPASTSDPSHLEMEQLNEERQIKEIELKSWIDAGRWPVFENTRAENLAAELDTADDLGIKPLHIDDPSFGQVASEGPIKWVVNENGELLVASHIIAHTVLTNGDGVVAAGEALIAVDGNERTCLEINTNSEHYQPDERSLEVGRRAFEQFGVRFEGEERPRDSGYGEGNSGVGGSDATTLRVFENMHPDSLAAELKTAEELDIRPMQVDDPEFEQMAQEAPITWVVLKSGQLLTAPSFVAHTVLSAGEAVIAAGEAIVTINGNERFCTEITTNSDHYQADAQSLEIGKQAFETFGVRFAEEGRQRDSGYGEGTSGVGGSDTTTPRVFENMHPESLAAELEMAEELGIRPMRVDDPEFEQMAQEAPITWVVLKSGQLLTAPSFVAHTVLSTGEAVIAAGEAIVTINGNERFCTEITTDSDHYQADEHSLEIGRQAFEAFGIEFSLAAGRDGHGGIAVVAQPEMIEHAPPSPQREGLEQQASTSGTSHLEVVQEPETREVADGDDGRQGDGYGRVDANRLREAREAMKELLVMWANRNSAGDGVQAEYERGESSQAQLPEGGESGNGGERGNENSGGNGGGNNGDHVVLDGESSGDESDEDENRSHSIAARLVDYIDEALLRSISESDSNVDVTVRHDEARREVLDALKEVLRDQLNNRKPENSKAMSEIFQKLGIEIPEDREARKEFFEKLRAETAKGPTKLSDELYNSYSHLAPELSEIEKKLCSQNRTDAFQIIERVSQEPRIVGFTDWVTQASSREAERMLDMVGELAEARRVLQEYSDDPSVIINIGQDVREGRGSGGSLDIKVEKNGEILRQNEVRRPKGGIEYPSGKDMIEAIMHTADKIKNIIKTKKETRGSDSPPHGRLEATVVVDPWPPTKVLHVGKGTGKQHLVYDTHGECTQFADTDLTDTPGKNLLQRTVDTLNNPKFKFENPIEFVERLNVIDRNGRALFELINETPRIRPARCWTWKDLQGGQ